MKRITSIILLSVLILPFFAACSLGSEATLLNFINSDVSKIDLNGKVVTICGENDSSEELFEQKVNTSMYDGIIKRIADIEKDLNCTIEIVDVDGTPSGITYLQTLASTGESKIDIITSFQISIAWK